MKPPLEARFRDRIEAGRALAAMLKQDRNGAALVLALPAGGVPVAAPIARELGLPLQLAPVSKVLLPWTSESGFGAVAFDGSVWIDQAAVETFGLSPQQLEKATADARTKVARRKARFGTRMPALGVARIVVAVPTAHDRSLDALRKLADEVVCADIRGGVRFAVADAYEQWHDVSDEEIEAMLKP